MHAHRPIGSILLLVVVLSLMATPAAAGPDPSPAPSPAATSSPIPCPSPAIPDPTSLGSPAPSGSPLTSGPPAVAAFEQRIATLIDERRTEQGLEPLSRRDDLARVARDYSRLMLQRGFFGHTGPSGDTVVDRVTEAGIDYRLVGENLFKHVGPGVTADAIVEGWMDSPGHRRSILRGDYTQSGVGVAVCGTTLLATQVFLRPPDASGD